MFIPLGVVQYNLCCRMVSGRLAIMWRFSYSKLLGLPDPKFDTQGFFTVTFMKRAKTNSVTNDTLNDTLNGTLNDTLNDRINDRLNSREKRVLEVLANSPGLRTNELSSLVEVSIPTLSRTLKNLINLGLIEYRGAKKTGGYYPLG